MRARITDLLPWVAASALAACADERPRPSVFLVVCDTLRADHVSSYGHERPTTPRLDELAAGATRFDLAISQAPATIPSMWNLMLSRYQAEVPAPLESLTLAEFLRAQGYATGAFVAQRFLDPELSRLDQGFERYDAEQELDHHQNSTRRASSVTDAAIEWMSSTTGPYFGWLVYFDPHDPYEAPEGFRGLYNPEPRYSGDRRADGLMGKCPPLPDAHRRFLVNAYDEEVRAMDHELGRFLDHLRERGLYDDALVVFTSDHGEELGEDGRWDHAQLLTPQEIRVPLVVKLPGQVEGKVVRAPVQTIDVYPTLVDLLAGGDTRALLGSLEGTSLLPLLDGRSDGRDRVAVALWEGQIATYDARYAYWLWQRTEDSGTEVLLDLRSGRREGGAPLAERRREALRLYEELRVDHAYWSANVERLRALGYL